jgi:hypothetical protein
MRLGKSDLSIIKPHEDHMSLLVENALQFLNQAIEDFNIKPKYSVINFYTGLELLLKARLLHEHWSITVSKEADWKKFNSGDFVSVSFDEILQRLEKIACTKIPDNSKIKFDAIRKSRNRMVHFYDIELESKKDQIASQQLNAWHSLHQLLLDDWKNVFIKWTDKFSKIENKLRSYRDYLQARFESLSSEIQKLKNEGMRFESCFICSFKSAKQQDILSDLKKLDCLVCESHEYVLLIKCLECEKKSFLRTENEGEFSCPHCQNIMTHENIKSELSEYSYHDDPSGNSEAFCGGCETDGSVIPYNEKWLCVICLDLSDCIYACEWCGAYTSYYMEDSAWDGCESCGGAKGHHLAEDN